MTLSVSDTRITCRCVQEPPPPIRGHSFLFLLAVLWGGAVSPPPAGFLCDSALIFLQKFVFIVCGSAAFLTSPFAPPL